MASALNTKVRNVQFNVTGFDQIIKYQKTLIANKKNEIQTEQNLLATFTKGTKEYEKQERVVNKLTKELERMDKELKKFTADSNAVRNTFNNLATAGPGAINKLDNALKRLAKSGITLTNEMKVKLEDLVGKGKNVTGAMVEMFSKGFNFDSMTRGVNKAKATYTELSNYVQIFNKHGRDLALIADNDAKAFERMGRNATGALIEMGKMDGTLQKVDTTMSNNRINEYIQGWQKVAQFSGATAQQVEAANRKIADAQKMLVQKNTYTVNNQHLFSFEEAEGAVKWLKQYQREAKLSSEEFDKLSITIKNTEDMLKKRSDGGRVKMMQEQFKSLSALSNSALADQKKFWTEMKNSTGDVSKIKQYSANLQQVIALEEKRKQIEIRTVGNAALEQAKNNAYIKSTTVIQQNIDKLQALRNIANQGTESKLIKDIDSAIRQLNQDLVTAQENVQMAQKYMTGGFGKATIEDLQKIRQGLADMRTKLKQAGDAKGIAELDASILKCDADIRKAGISSKEFNAAMTNPRSVFSLKTLTAAYETLKAQIERAGITQKEYNDKAMQMRAIKTQIDSLNGQLSNQESIWKRLGTQLTNIIMHWVGLQMIVMKVIKAFHNAVELSDQMTNVRKVTGLTNDEVVGLTNSIMDIDTRTANTMLMEMAEQAGKLGLATKSGAEGIVSFVKAGEKIVNTLGDIGGAEAITELLKVNDVINKDSEGIEKDLMRIGSAVLNVGNNSKATYAAVTEYTKRMGPAASATGLTMQQVMGLGGAFSSLGTDSAVAATATQRVLMGIVNNTEGVAKALNLSTKELDELIARGDTMEAFQIVLRELGSQGTQSVDKFLKTLGGRYNQQARSALMLLTQHVGDLQYQINLAEQGFADGTLVEKEFEKANNNLAGVIAQISNEFYEMTTSADMANGIFVDMAKVVLTVVRGMKEGNVMIGAFAAMVVGLTAELWKNTQAAIANAAANEGAATASKGFFGTIGGIVNIVKFASQALYFHTLKLVGVKGATEAARISTENLKTALSSNWITIAAAAIGMLVAAIAKYVRETKEASKAVGELKNIGQEEVNTLLEMKEELSNVNLLQEERKKKILEFNKQFGSYLTNILSEKSTVEELAVAYNEAAAGIREKIAAQQEEEGRKRGEEASREDRDSATGDMAKALSRRLMKGGKGLSERQQAQAMTDIQSFVNEYVAKHPKATDQEVMTALGRRFASDSRFITVSKVNDKTITRNVISNVEKIQSRNSTQTQYGRGVDALYQAVSQYVKGVLTGQKHVNMGKQEASNTLNSARQVKIQNMKDIEKILRDTTGKYTARDKYDYANQYLDIVKQITTYLNSEEGKADTALRKKFANANRTEFVKSLMPSLVKVVKPWGESTGDWETMGGEELKDVIDYFEKLVAAAKGKNYNIKETLYKTPAGVTLPTNIDTWGIESIRDWAYAQATEARKIQDEKNHMNRNATFQWKKGSDSSPKFEYSDGAIAELDRYYSEREKNIRDMRENEEISEAEMNRRILKNEKEHLIQRSKLRRTFTTDDQAMITAFDAWWASVKELDKLERDKIQAEWKEANDKQIKENNKKAQVDETDRERKANEYRRKINQILENEDEFNKLTNEFKNNLDELDILLSGMVTEDPNVLADTIKQRMAFVFSVMGEAYTLNVTNLKDKITEFGIKDWILSEEEAQLLINRIQTFSDNYDNAIRTSANRIKKTFDMYWKASGNQEMWADAQKKGETANKNNGWLQDVIGGQTFGGRNLKTDSELQLYQLKIAASQAYIDQLEKEMDARIANAEAEGNTDEVKRLVAEREYLISDATTNLNALMEEFSNKQTDISMGLVRNLEPYKDMLVQFADDFGSNVFGKKEDRQKAAQALLTTFVKTLNSMLTQYLIYLATKNMADKVQMGKELTDQGTTTAAKIAANSAEGQSKEVASKGLVGLATATAITVAMTALTAMILSKINQAKSQLGVGNVGKLGSGMLTYAEGKYIEGDRVVADGNDGKRYNARYTDNIKTGVYHGPHVAVFSEDGDEMVIDHPTLVRTMNQAPWLLKGIQDIHRHGRLTLDYAGLAQGARNLRLLPSRAMRQYADGNVDEILGGGMDMAGASADTLELASTLKGVQQALEYLASNPVHINMYGDSNSLDAKQKKLNGWKKRMGIS